MRLFAKSPMQMRREGETGEKLRSPPAPGPVEATKLPPLHRDTADEIGATIEWLAHVQAGRIEVK